ncbi:hypothetical protein EP7_002510 [Isosphaeraceae bacterium EP7]
MSLQLADSFVGRWAIALMWSAVACWGLAAVAAVARGIHDSRARRWWLLLAALSAAMSLEMALGTRYQLIVLLRSALKTAGRDYYLGRRPVQGALIVGGLVVAAGLAAWAWSIARRVSPGCKLALIGALVGWAGIVIETISLHQIDMHYSIYWAIWFTGLALTFAGLARGGNPGRLDDAIQVDSTGRRIARLAAAVVLLSLPEVVDLVWRRLGG